MSPRTPIDTARRDLEAERAHLRGRVVELEGEVDGDALERMRAIVDDPARTLEQLHSHLSTRLMEAFRVDRSRGAFGLLYELNQGHLYGQVAQRLRRYQSRADPHDLLQEVFFNVYRYPRRFDAARDDAFRIWTTTIVRNTVLKHLRSLSRSGRAEVPFEDLSEHPEETAQDPLGGAIARESEDACKRAYLLYLHLYLDFYRRLSDREQRALQLVEVEGASYRDAALELGIKLENLKMVIFRARRKIARAMKRVFDGLPPELRPARPAGAPAGKSAAAALAEQGTSTPARPSDPAPTASGPRA